MARLQAGRPGFDYRQELGYFLLTATFSPSVGLSYPLGARGSVIRSKAAGAWSWPLTSN